MSYAINKAPETWGYYPTNFLCKFNIDAIRGQYKYVEKVIEQSMKLLTIKMKKVKVTPFLTLKYIYPAIANSKLYFIYLHSFAMYDNKKNTFYHRELKQITDVVESLNIPLIDIHKELFKKHKDPLSLFPFRKRGHYTELGYQLVSETIFNKINELER